MSFNTELSLMADPNTMLVSNVLRAIVKQLVVKFEENEILSMVNYDVLVFYQDLWEPDSKIIMQQDKALSTVVAHCSLHETTNKHQG